MIEYIPSDEPTHLDSSITPERAVRLLRAKAGELEGYVANVAPVPEVFDIALAADLALIAALLADHIERVEFEAVMAATGQEPG